VFGKMQGLGCRLFLSFPPPPPVPPVALAPCVRTTSPWLSLSPAKTPLRGNGKDCYTGYFLQEKFERHAVQIQQTLVFKIPEMMSKSCFHRSAKRDAGDKKKESSSLPCVAESLFIHFDDYFAECEI